MLQCHTLEQQIGTGYLQLCLESPTDACSMMHDAKEDILAKRLDPQFIGLQIPPTTCLISATDRIASSWNSIWDEELEYGVRDTRLMQGLFWL